jgi:hypothetical protein
MAERRLREVQPISGAGKASDVGDRRHQLQVTDLEIHIMRLLHRYDDDKEFRSCTGDLYD